MKKNNYEILAPTLEEKARVEADIKRLGLEEKLTIFHPKQSMPEAAEVKYKILISNKKQVKIWPGPVLRVFIDELQPAFEIRGADKVLYDLKDNNLFGTVIIHDTLVGIYPAFVMSQYYCQPTNPDALDKKNE